MLAEMLALSLGQAVSCSPNDTAGEKLVRICEQSDSSQVNQCYLDGYLTTGTIITNLYEPYDTEAAGTN